MVYRILPESKLKSICNMYGIKKNYLIFSSVNPFLIQDSSQMKQICSDKIDDEAARRGLNF